MILLLPVVRGDRGQPLQDTQDICFHVLTHRGASPFAKSQKGKLILWARLLHNTPSYTMVMVMVVMLTTLEAAYLTLLTNREPFVKSVWEVW